MPADHAAARGRVLAADDGRSMRRPETHQSRRQQEARRLHRRFLSVRQPRAGGPHRPRRHARGEARGGAHQRAPDDTQGLPAPHVVERYGGEFPSD